MIATIDSRRAHAFIAGLNTPRVRDFKNCFEAGMDYETALGCAGLTDQPALRAWWDEAEEVAQ